MTEQFLLNTTITASVLAVMLVLAVRTPPQKLPDLVRAIADVVRALRPFGTRRK